MDKYAVFGNPVAHSKSPQIHSQFAKQTEQNLDYSAIKADKGQFEHAVKSFAEAGGQGCNVTVPFKEAAFELADSVSERAELAQAVNTLVINDDGTISADNTDGAGLVWDLKANQVTIEKAKILIIGAGGASRGVIKPLLDCNPASITICNRTAEKAQKLAGHFAQYGVVKAKAMHQIDESFDIVINSTSASLNGEIPKVSGKIFKNEGVAYDMAYGNEPTVFVEWALANGCANAIDGLGMLVGQAAESFNIWRGVMPDAQSVVEQLRTELVD